MRGKAGRPRDAAGIVGSPQAVTGANNLPATFLLRKKRIRINVLALMPSPRIAVRLSPTLCLGVPVVCVAAAAPLAC